MRGAINDDDGPIRVALTREKGKNDKLRKALESFSMLEQHELPCIMHAEGPDIDALPDKLQDPTLDYIVITSPEAARVLASAWCNARSSAQVAAVGKATKAALVASGISVSFVPSRATAACLVDELPQQENGRSQKVLYPASAKARPTIVEGLTARGFQVERLDTYDTVPAVWTEDEKQQSREIDIVCIASPSALQGWLVNCEDGDDNRSSFRPVAACIGETSAAACREQGDTFSHILCPDRPGLEGWVETIHEAATMVTRDTRKSSTRMSSR